MDARPIRDLLADLVGDGEARRAYGADPAGYLAAHGHPDLPEPLLAEAVVSFADTAPVEVASALAPYVTAQSPIPDPSPESDHDPDPADWFDLLTSSEPTDDPFDEHPDAPESHHDWTDPSELDFGTGAAPSHEPPADLDTESVDHDPPAPDDTPMPQEWATDPHFTPEPPIAGLPDAEDDEDDSDDDLD